MRHLISGMQFIIIFLSKIQSNTNESTLYYSLENIQMTEHFVGFFGKFIIFFYC